MGETPKTTDEKRTATPEAKRANAFRVGADLTIEQGFGRIMFDMFSAAEAVSRADVIAMLEPIAANAGNVFRQRQAELIILRLQEMRKG